MSGLPIPLSAVGKESPEGSVLVLLPCGSEGPERLLVSQHSQGGRKAKEGFNKLEIFSLGGRARKPLRSLEEIRKGTEGVLNQIRHYLTRSLKTS